MLRQENAFYAHAKNACYLCGQPHDVCDTEVSIDYEGVLAICRGCVADMAHTMGFALDDRSVEIDGLRTELAEVAERATFAETLLDELESAAIQIRAARAKKDRARKAAAKAEATVAA